MGDSRGIWHVVAASRQGTSHKRKDVPCQDAFECRFSDTRSSVFIAVADGAGSAPRAYEGSHLAVKQALDFIGANIVNTPLTAVGLQTLVRSAYESSICSINQLAEAQGVGVKDFSTTLTLVLCHNGWLAAGQIGDGIAVIENLDGELSAITHPQNGEYANETFFLTSENGLSVLETTAVNASPRAIYVMTDGIVRLCFNLLINRPFAPFFKGVLSVSERLIETSDKADSVLSDYLDSDTINSRTDDDKTLVIAFISRLDAIENSQAAPGEADTATLERADVDNGQATLVEADTKNGQAPPEEADVENNPGSPAETPQVTPEDAGVETGQAAPGEADIDE